ncbi:hypothetical protein ACFVJS_26660 [Nocardioides sp. NPDC057772]|uniref:hypothetical protein n=1 Tax=Nocardioides sp. NPDC057772 TaxID=3346245 RepID=UPI0036708EC3
MWTAARRQRRTTRAVARAALLAAVVVTVAGLLAMHGLSLHGTGTDGEHGRLSLPAAHVDHAHSVEHADHAPADHAPADHAPADHAPADHAPADHTGQPGSDGHTMMVLCAAFLLAAGALLLSGLWRRTPAWWFARARDRSRIDGTAPFVMHPANGPPPEWAFSVIRC